MKILYIITQADGGGAQNYVLTLAHHFKGSIAAGTESQRLFTDAKALGIPTYPLKHLKRNISPYHDFLAIIELIDLIKRERPDIVHLNSSKAGFIGSLIKPYVRAKIVFTAHGFVFSEPHSLPVRSFYLAAEKLASYFRDYIITVSDFDRRSALHHKLIGPEKIGTIHNGLSPITFLARDEARKQLGIPEHIFTFGTVANFYKTKGLDVLIDAVSVLPKEILEKSQFVILGDGPEHANLQSKILNLQLQSTVRLPGNISNAKQYLKAFDVFVLPSRKEGFPYVLLEALQAGLPILSTRTGGIPEALGNAGVLVKPEDSSALASECQELFTQQLRRSTLKEHALQQAQLFTLESMLKQTEEIYKKITQ